MSRLPTKKTIKNLEIFANYGDLRRQDKDKHDCIWFKNNKETNTIIDKQMFFNIEEIKEINQHLSQIIKFFENLPEKGDIVKIINGRFEGCEGTVYCVDKIDKEKPLMIKLFDTKEYNSAIVYLHDNDVVVTNKA